MTRQISNDVCNDNGADKRRVTERKDKDKQMESREVEIRNDRKNEGWSK